MIRPALVLTGIERENLFFEARRTVNREEKEQTLLELLQAEPGSGIVYRRQGDESTRSIPGCVSKASTRSAITAA